MKRITFLLLLIIISTACFSQTSIKAGFGQELGWLGGALEYKLNKISVGVGAGLYDPDTKLLGWQVFGTYYLKDNTSDYDSSPYLLVGYGVYGNEATRNYSGGYDIDKTYYAIYGLAGYRWWGNKFSLQLGVGAANNLTVSNDVEFIFSASIGFKL